jgi:hypothetical protein
MAGLEDPKGLVTSTDDHARESHLDPLSDPLQCWRSRVVPAGLLTGAGYLRDDAGRQGHRRSADPAEGVSCPRRTARRCA